MGRKKQLLFFIAILAVILAFAFSSLGMAQNKAGGTIAGTFESILPQKETLNVYVMNVGQGSSCLIVTPESKVILIDAGTKSASKKLISDIKKLGVERIDLLIATHPHSDHIGGILPVFESFDVGEFRMPEVEHTTQQYLKMLEYLYDNDIKAKRLVGGDDKYIELDSSIEIKVLAPLGKKYKSLNDYSAAFRIEYGSKSVLITGDNQSVSEAEMIKAHDKSLKSDVLIVAHHGSKTSTSAKFLDRVKPEYAIISCGKGNSYGHPDKAVISRLKKRKIETYRTDKKGTVAVFINDDDCILKSK